MINTTEPTFFLGLAFACDAGSKVIISIAKLPLGVYCMSCKSKPEFLLLMVA